MRLDPTPSVLDYYATHGPVTDPAPNRALLASLPTDVAALCRLVQGLLVHIHWAERMGVTLTESRRGDANLRAVALQLERLRELDDAPLTEPRPHDRRLVGNCRDFSVLLCAILREHRVPARARCGFAAYFTAGRYEEHWVCEVWDAPRERWTRVDAQLDAFQQETLGIDFDPLDVPPGRFLLAGEAWQRCRAEEADPDAFGIFDMHGWWFIQGNVVRDLLSLNKLELLPWDGWGRMVSPGRSLSAEDLTFTDRIATLTVEADRHLEEMRSLLASDPGLIPPSGWASQIMARAGGSSL